MSLRPYYDQETKQTLFLQSRDGRCLSLTALFLLIQTSQSARTVCLLRRAKHHTPHHSSGCDGTVLGRQNPAAMDLAPLRDPPAVSLGLKMKKAVTLARPRHHRGTVSSVGSPLILEWAPGPRHRTLMHAPYVAEWREAATVLFDLTTSGHLNTKDTL